MVNACLRVLRIIGRAPAVTVAWVEESAGHEVRNESICVYFRKDVYANNEHRQISELGRRVRGECD